MPLVSCEFRGSDSRAQAAGGRHQLRQPEIQNLQTSIDSKTKIARLQVAMHEALLMGCFEPCGQLNAETHNFRRRQRIRASLVSRVIPAMYSVTKSIPSWLPNSWTVATFG